VKFLSFLEAQMVKRILRIMAFAVALYPVLICTAALAEDRVLNLTRSIDIALENNLSLKVSREKITQKFWEERDSYTNFLPRVSGSFTYTRLDRVPVVSFPSPVPPFTPIEAAFGDENMYTLTFTLSQPVFTGGRLANIWRGKQEETKIAETALEIDKTHVAMQVVEAYYSILKSSRLLANAQTLKNQRASHLADVKKFFDAGLATKADILKTEVALAEAEQKVIEAENAVNLARANFKTLLNLPPDAEPVIEDSLEAKKDTKTLDEWKKLAAVGRRELSELDQVESTLKYARKVVNSSYYPQVFFLANWKDERGTSLSLNKWYQSWSGVVSAELDIWNWHSTRKKLNAINSQISQISAQRQQMYSAISLETTSAYLDFSAAWNRTTVSEKAVEDAKENVRVTGLLFKEGMATTTDMLDAQSALFNAQSGYFQALYDYQVAYYRLLKASGGLLGSR